MSSEQRKFECSDSHIMNYFVRIPDGEPKAVVLILHGMAEYGERYNNFARFLADNGYAVYVPDHRGHGPVAQEEGELGCFARENGWRKVIDDIQLGLVNEVIMNDFPAKEVFLFGHSMGSFLARSIVALYPDIYAGAIFSGTGMVNSLACRFGELIAEHEIHRFGDKHPSLAMNKLIFGSYNKSFENEGEFAWLSRDRREVRKYIEDPLCGFICSSGFFRDFLGGIRFACSPEAASMISKSLPILLISGADDPVGSFGKGVRQAYDEYCGAGIKDVSIYLEEGGRHELLNDITRDSIQDRILSWLNEHL